MPFPGCVTAAAASVGGGGSLSSRRPSVRPSVCPAERAGASQDDSVRGANMTSRREARRTTKEDSSSFFVGGEHRPAAWTERSLARALAANADVVPTLTYSFQVARSHPARRFHS